MYNYNNRYSLTSDIYILHVYTQPGKSHSQIFSHLKCLFVMKQDKHENFSFYYNK